jgi:hypothetical protein
LVLRYLEQDALEMQIQDWLRQTAATMPRSR